MSELKTFTAKDGHHFNACISKPEGTPRALLIIIQEIFGLTEHICSLTRKFAAEGYIAVAPAFFDRVEKECVLEYNEQGGKKGRELISRIASHQVMLDIQAVIDEMGTHTKVAVVGYCWGGSMAYLAASELKLDAAIAYYGTRIHQMLDRRPNCPIMFHFGQEDHLVSGEAINQIRQANPDAPLYLYPGAGHAFSCEPRNTYHPVSTQLAVERSLKFLEANI